ncbi:hypothetical protein HDU85_002669 [Gaertneriomyces sp. JEL0708]|nr:hypothetical protein HDU85_002669 [Gaertneriomyces sp. JEL0708]
MAILNQGVGWAVVLGFGIFFSVLITLITFGLKRYANEANNSEHWATGGRCLKPGLVACAVVSSWTWAATLLQSSAVAYRYGISGPFWYAAGATVQVLLFAILAIAVKRVAPNSRTFLEIIRARYGNATHIVFIFFGFACNLVVTAMLLLGGAAVVTDLTGMNIYAASMLIPLGVVAYVVSGGLKATFLTDYMHTVLIYAIILVFGFTVYATSDLVGSPSRMYDLLKVAAERHPVEDNADGSYLTMSSLQGLIFGIINLVGNFGTVFVDQAYWQRAIAAHPGSTVKAYLLGGLCWFAIPFFLATTLGLSAVALETDAAFPTFPNRMAPADVNAGLVAPNAAVALLGSGGATAMLVLLFMAVTSSASAELVAVSSICTYDIYRPYVNPKANGRDLMRMSHYTTLGFGCIMGVLAIVLFHIGVSLGYLYLLMGVLLSPAVFPIAFTLCWKKQSAKAAVAGALVGLACGLIAWLVTCKAYYGYIDIVTSGENYPMLAGNLTSLVVSGLVSTIISLLQPDNYDFESTKNLKQLVDCPSEEQTLDADEVSEEKLAAASRFAYRWAGSLTVALILIIPIPLHLSDYVFSKGFFTGWVIIGLLWSITATAIVTFLPIWESRHGVMTLIAGVFRDLSGRGHPVGSVNKRTHDEITVVSDSKDVKMETVTVT